MLTDSSVITTARACPLLNDFRGRVIATVDRHGSPLRNVLWEESGFIGVDPIPMADVSEFYKKEYRQSYKGAHSPKTRHVVRAARCALDRHKRIKPFLPSGRLHTLDAGASSGEFVYLMKKMGREAEGIEPHIGYANYARSRLDLDVSNCTFKEFNPEGKCYQLITIFHVLEHLEFPVEDLIRLGSMLADSGILAIEVPNILHRGMKFSHKWHRGHLNGFNESSLRVTAARAGLKAISCGKIGDGGNLFGVFRKGSPMSVDDARAELAGNTVKTILELQKNTDLDYHLRADTWMKIPSKFFSNMEERSHARKFTEPVKTLDAIYASCS
jgi:2-polyprenyl-3-methyl-5-hydroxy-6-metoxy-1,4-benzoquinol methylase